MMEVSARANIQVVNVRSKLPNTTYIGRANRRWNLPQSKWANPYVVGRNGDLPNVLRLYDAYIRASPRLWNRLGELQGLTLACWCKPEPCHGDVLARLVEEFLSTFPERGFQGDRVTWPDLH